MQHELFGEDDLIIGPTRSTYPRQEPQPRLLVEDLALSSYSEDSLEISDTEDEPASTEDSYTPATIDMSSNTIQDSILEVLSDLTMIQELAQNKDCQEIHTELSHFHTKLQVLIKGKL